MRLLVSVAVCVLALPAAYSGVPDYHVFGGEPAGWERVFSSIGLQPGTAESSRIAVLRSGAGASAGWIERVERGGILILEGESPVAEAFGFRGGRERVRVSSIVDIRRPKLPIIWQTPIELPKFLVPAQARVFATERWSGSPVLAGYRRGSGAALWLIASPGDSGYERFPYLLQALRDLGLETPFRSARLWAFFDYSYRLRVDLDYFAARWRSAGIAALHIAAWHFFEPDRERDAYLNALIAACHRNGILTYAWLELPHVSEKFWNDYPQWREKTADLHDAHLDWRKLMNLTNRECFRTVANGVRDLVSRFDWDGVNLAELYFESLEGASNPSRFTPMNDDVRAQFRQARGFDPVEVFGTRKGDLRAFLDFRVDLARRVQEEWIREIEGYRRSKPDLDLILTHVDDRFDTGMRDAIGADASGVLPMLERHDFTFLIEDPATIWHLGPQRYPEIARRYLPLTRFADRLAIDINVVDRYQDVYPTKQQTGAELFQLVSSASGAFSRVALYFESSILPPDLELLPSAAAVVSRCEVTNGKWTVESPRGVGLAWKGPALVDGRLWPVANDAVLWLPAGRHVVEPATQQPGFRIIDFNGDLELAGAQDGTTAISYQSSSRAIAVSQRRPSAVEVDGAPYHFQPLPSGDRWAVLLPRGRHSVVIR